MISGTYQVSMKLKDDVQQGTLVLKEENGHVSGTLKTKDVTSSFSGGSVYDNRFSFAGVIHKFILKIRYKASGILEGENLTIDADTKYGTFIITGKRVKG